MAGTKAHRQLAALLVLGILLVSGTSCERSTWTAGELSDWYSRHADGSPHYGPLYYRGSDAEFHYFVIRAMDDWVFPKVARGEIGLQDERLLVTASSGANSPFPGHYAVDPLNGFKKIKMAENEG